MEIKISHQKTFDNASCVYQRGFNINRLILNDFANHLEKEIKNSKDYYKTLYLKIPMTSLYKCVFMNLTQTEEFLKFMRKNKLKFNEKRANLKANGYLILK